MGIFYTRNEKDDKRFHNQKEFFNYYSLENVFKHASGKEYIKVLNADRESSDDEQTNKTCIDKSPDKVIEKSYKQDSESEENSDIDEKCFDDNEDSKSAMSDSENSEEEANKTVSCPFFYKDGKNYPVNFFSIEELKFEKDVIGNEGLLTLKPNVWINDEIVNNTCLLLASKASEQRMRLRFASTLYMGKIMNENGISQVAVRWARKSKLSNFNIIVAPTQINRNHWIVLLIIINLKIVVVLDSLRGSCLSADTKNAISSLLSVIQHIKKKFRLGVVDIVLSERYSTAIGG